MKIGRLEIRWTNRAVATRAMQGDSAQLLAAFAVPDTTAWWRAVNWILDVAEAETVRNARNSTMHTNMVLNAVGAGEGIDLVRTKLKEARENAIHQDRSEQVSRA